MLTFRQQQQQRRPRTRHRPRDTAGAPLKFTIFLEPTTQIITVILISLSVAHSALYEKRLSPRLAVCEVQI